MDKWQDRFANVQDLPLLVEQIPDLPAKVFGAAPFAVPPGFVWEFVWGCELENEAMADSLAELLLDMTAEHGKGYHVGLDDGSYACGFRTEAIVTFGIGCPMQSASAEIWRLVPTT